MIIRGTTPYHNFILPLLADEIQTVYITYYQNGEVILEKTNLVAGEITIEDIVDIYGNASIEEVELTEEEIHSCQLTTHLTQEDTLKFEYFPAVRKDIVSIQIRVLTTDGEAYASNPVNERLMDVYHEGVITDEE